MKGDIDMNETRTCPHCGASVPGDTCPYCGTVFENTAAEDAAENLPEVTCIFAGVTFREIRFYLGVIAFSVIAGICIITQAQYLDAIWFAIIFMIPGIITAIVMVKRIIAYFKVAINGTDVDGEVLGYKNDLTKQGDDYCQIAKILVTGQNGKKILLIPLHSTDRPYPLNSSVKVRIYKEYARVTKFSLV